KDLLVRSILNVEAGVETVATLPFVTSSVSATLKQDVVGPSNLPGKELSLRSQEVDSGNLHDVFIPRWNVFNDAILDDFDTSREFIDHLAPPVMFS
ncbi:hypothetical protein Tco_0552666, partial [Tanacetum coccineum]